MARSSQSTPEQRIAFGVALKEAAENAGVGSSIKLAEHLSAHGYPVTQPTVATWFRGANEPDRSTVLVLEEALGLALGALSAQLGWVPVGVDVDDTEAAILQDESISGDHRRALVVMLRTFRDAHAARQD